MTISAPDIARYRGGRHSTKVILNRVPKLPVLTAQINQSAFSYPLSQLTIDNIDTLGTVKPGHMVMIGTAPGLYDVTIGVVKSLVGSVLSLDAKSQGDPGTARSIMTPLADNQYITIIKFRPGHGLLSSIRNGTFYKNWDIPYNGQGSNPDPVPVMGSWRQAFCPVGGTVTLDFTSAGSFAWAGRSIVSTTWDIDGASLSGGALTDADITAEFEPGFYELELTLVDTLGRSRTGYRYVWINTDSPDDDNAPFSYRNPFQIVDDKQVMSRDLGLQFFKNLSEIDDLFPGQAFLITEVPTFNGEPLEGDSFVASYVGYQTDLSQKTSYKIRENTLSLRNPYGLADFIPIATNEINESINPQTWAEVAPVLSNPVGAVWYLAAHHAPYLIDGHDFNYDSALLAQRRQTFQFRATNLAGQLKTVSEMALALIGNNSNGRLRIVRNPVYLSLDERNALPTKWALNTSDIAEYYARQTMGRIAASQVWGYAFAYDGSQSIPFASLAPGYVRAQGDGSQTMTPFIVSASDGQNRVNEITGHEFANINGLPPFGIKLKGNMDFIEPIDADSWLIHTVAARFDALGKGWVNERLIPQSVTRTWDGRIKTIEVSVKPETYGVPGITIPVDRGGGNNWYLSDWNPGLFDVYQPVFPDNTGADVPLVFAINSNGVLARSFSFTDKLVSWQKMEGFAGAALGIAIDYNSPYFGAGGALALTLLTYASDGLHVYRIDDGFADSPTLTEFVNSPLAVGTGFNGKAAKVVMSRLEPDFVLVVWHNQTGTRFSRSTSSTPTLSAPANVGAAVTDTSRDSELVGADVFQTTQVVIAPDGTDGLDGNPAYFLYQATGSGAFSKVTGNPLADETAFIGFARTIEGIAYTSYTVPAPPAAPPALGVVTFDPGGETDYTVNGAGIVALGHPDNCAYNSFNANGSGGSVGVSVDCDYPAGLYNITDVEFDVKPDLTGSVTDFTEVIKITAFSNGKKVGSGNAKLRETYGDGWFRYGLTSAELKLSEPPDSIRVSYSYNFTDSSAFTIVYAYLDNIVISGGPLDNQTTRTLYAVTLSGPTWQDITPTPGRVPLKPFGLAAASDNAGLQSVIAYSELGRAYLFNRESGVWELIKQTGLSGVARGGDVVIGWGLNTLGLSPDKGETFYNRLGDWVATVGPVGEITVVAGVL